MHHGWNVYIFASNQPDELNTFSGKHQQRVPHSMLFVWYHCSFRVHILYGCLSVRNKNYYNSLRQHLELYFILIIIANFSSSVFVTAAGNIIRNDISFIHIGNQMIWST